MLRPSAAVSTSSLLALTVAVTPLEALTSLMSIASALASVGGAIAQLPAATLTVTPLIVKVPLTAVAPLGAAVVNVVGIRRRRDPEPAALIAFAIAQAL